jgi:DNA polymerase-3 subunit beta
VLTGIYWHTVDGKLYLAATDGYRLAEKEVMKAATEISAIVPVDAAQEVLRTVDESTESIEILFDDIQVRFRFDEIEITSKLIDGQFPNYRQLIPKKSDITFTINKSDLLRVTKIAALFAYGSGGAITLTTKQEQNELQVRSIASEVGENTSSIPVDGLESDGEITLNARYITDLLSTLNTERLQIGFSGGLSPCVITPVETKGYTHIIMPIKS